MYKYSSSCIRISQRPKKKHNVLHLGCAQGRTYSDRPVERRIAHIDIAAEHKRQVVVTIDRTIGLAGIPPSGKEYSLSDTHSAST